LAYTGAKIFYLVMKNFILILILAFSVATGIVSGIAYERFSHREECLRMAFDNSGVENLSEEEISEITRALNSNDSNPSALEYSGTSPQLREGKEQVFSPSDEGESPASGRGGRG
jgi:hypothetical protein